MFQEFDAGNGPSNMLPGPHMKMKTGWQKAKRQKAHKNTPENRKQSEKQPSWSSGSAFRVRAWLEAAWLIRKPAVPRSAVDSR